MRYHFACVCGVFRLVGITDYVQLINNGQADSAADKVEVRRENDAVGQKRTFVDMSIHNDR